MKASANTSSASVRDLPEAPRSFNEEGKVFTRRWFVAAEWTLLALLLLQFVFHTAPKAWQTLNSDFPNYYLTARLTREHYDTSRIYEWIWLQRQKDHRAIDQSTVGMPPITAFSTLVLYPLATMPALKAKHYWLAINFCLLLATLWLLHSLTSLPWRRLLLVVALSFPLRANFLLGQYYVLLLFLLTLACFFYVDRRRFRAGVLIGFSAALKIFPVIFLLFFLRKKDWRAFTGGVAAILSCFAVSILVFGWELNRTYITQVLPATFRGECLAPYNLQSASLSALLHRLFVFEPQLNPHPAMNLPWMFAVLHSILLIVIAAPAILLIIPAEYSPRRISIEWASVLLASLAISTSPASYLFTLLILPAALIWRLLDEKGKHGWTALLLSLYIAAGFLGGRTGGGDGWIALLEVPRLYALILLAAFSYLVLLQQEAHYESKSGRTQWSIAVCAILMASVVINLRHQHGLYSDYRWRISEPAEVLSMTHPATQRDKTLSIALLSGGYHLATPRANTVTFSDKRDGDYLAVTAADDKQWVEHAGAESTIRLLGTVREDIDRAESPVASPDGRWLAFLREDHGRARLWVRNSGDPDDSGRLITAPQFNILEMSFLPDGSLVFAAVTAGQTSLFVAHQNGSVRYFDADNSRYPSVSPDGHWLAFSRLQRGNWNLWLRDLRTGQTRRLTDVECNDTDSSWSEDSQTLVYASDCGRGLWLPALCRRRIPR